MSRLGEKDHSSRVQSAVYAAIDSLNEQLSPEQQVEKDPNTVLLGQNGKLDSMGFINFIVLLEEKCLDKCGVSILLSDTLNSTDANPFQTVSSLTDFLSLLIDPKVSQ